MCVLNTEKEYIVDIVNMGKEDYWEENERGIHEVNKQEGIHYPVETRNIYDGKLK